MAIFSQMKERLLASIFFDSGDPSVDLSRSLYVFTSLTVAILTVVFGSLYLINGVSNIAIAQFVIAITALGCLVHYRRYQAIKWPIHVLLCVIWVASVYRVYKFGGISAPTFYTYVLIPVYVGAILSLRYAVAWTFVFLCVPAVFYYFELTGIHFDTEVPRQTLEKARIYGLISANIIVLAVVILIKKIFSKYQTLLNAEKRKKATLLRVLAHDLSNPLMVLNYNFEKIKAGHSSQKIFETCERTLQATVKILDDVKKLDALQSGKLELELVSVSLQEIFEDLKMLFEIRASDKNINVNWPEIKSGLTVYANKSALIFQVLGNLLSNAIKFSEKGSQIIFSLETVGPFQILTLQDFGMGMDSNLISQIFSETKPTSRKGTQGESGTGFGLLLAQQYLRAMGGELSIESNLALGTSQNLSGTKVTIKLRTD